MALKMDMELLSPLFMFTMVIFLVLIGIGFIVAR